MSKQDKNCQGCLDVGVTNCFGCITGADPDGKGRAPVFHANKRIGGRTNLQRAEVGEAALLASLEMRGDLMEIDTDSVRDLLADLLHFCDKEGYENPIEMVRDAFLNWEMER